MHACGFACVCIHVFGCLFAEWVLPPAKKSINVLSKIITSIPAKVGFEQIKQNLFCFLQLFSCCVQFDLDSKNKIEHRGIF